MEIHRTVSSSAETIYRKEERRRIKVDQEEYIKKSVVERFFSWIES